MIKITQNLEIITPCFNGGAEPEKTAEIRPSSIRGQLRWWFRVLGGFKSSTCSLREQENAIFGGANDNDDSGTASRLIVRVIGESIKSTRKDGQELGHKNFTSPAFLTFPIQSREKQGQKTSYDARGVIESGNFNLQCLWTGSRQEKANLQALLTIYSHLGSLGFRSRRAMGSLAPTRSCPMTIGKALEQFRFPQNIIIKSLPANSSSHAISKLGSWLKYCRAHGRSGQNDYEKDSPYFNFAKNDHDIGYDTPGSTHNAAYRPALGLPIIQRVGKDRDKKTNNWEWNHEKGKAQGRFASPVILRPHKTINGDWSALVIFVESKKWLADEKVFLNGKPRDVSPDLYETMKNDPELRDFLTPESS